MKLSRLLAPLDITEGYQEVEITDIVYDSRKAKQGCAFVCMRGSNSDGHKYAAGAAQAGAAVICEDGEFVARYLDQCAPSGGWQIAYCPAPLYYYAQDNTASLSTTATGTGASENGPDLRENLDQILKQEWDGLLAGLVRRYVLEKSTLPRTALAFFPAALLGSVLWQSMALALVYGGEAKEAFFLAKLVSRGIQFALTASVDTLIVWLLLRRGALSGVQRPIPALGGRNHADPLCAGLHPCGGLAAQQAGAPAHPRAVGKAGTSGTDSTVRSRHRHQR